MKDKEIRNILIEYLKIQNKEYRIYQEKSIGSSICDLMLVTNKLTGFEIKSDSDNYERLEGQIKAYDKFFDENYIVVGRSHIKSIEDKIPKYWGIYAVDQSNIEVVRKAKPNKNVSRKRQLSVLWKIELKNILLKNHLPLYAQKSKSFLHDVISKNVGEELLGKQIAEELMRRDYSAFESEDKTIKSYAEENAAELIEFPEAEIIDRLSEEDLSSFTLDKWMAIYKKALDRQNRKNSHYSEAVSALNENKSVEHKVLYTEINVSLGVPWVSAEIISQFAIDILKAKQDYYYKYDPYTQKNYRDKKIPIVQHEKITGYWHVEKDPYNKSAEQTVVYGTSRMSALHILENTLNLRQIKINDGTEYNEMETLAALDKQKVMQQAFKGWIWKDEARRWEVEEAYNKMFGQYESVTYDGSDIKFADMNPDIQLFDYQKNAVKKIMCTPNTLLSFDVGSGKTYIMIAAAMEMRKNGLSRKNMFVVPNNIVGQWEKMFTELYPSAKVLAVDPKSFTVAKRAKVLEQMKKEDYDGIIIAYSCFEMIPLSTKYLMLDMNNTLNRFGNRITEINKIGFSGAATNVKREMDYVHKTMNELISCINAASYNVSFDDLEINTLFVDEAHNFKNIPLRTKLKNIRGINTKGSQKCLEMMKKVHYVQKANGGRGVVFATGTPLSNSISDTYAMQCYLQYDELVKIGLERFDNWIKTFARPESVCEIDVNASGFRIVQRFKEFFNLPELSRMFGEISIFHNVDQSGLPKLSGYTDVLIDKSAEMDAYMKDLYQRTEIIRAGDISPKKDNMLKISTDGRKAALSLALVGKEEKRDEYSKIRQCVDKILEVYRQYDGCSQLVFCDISTPKTDKYNVYKDVEALLKEAGVPAKEIAFIHSYQTEERKLKLFEDVNYGKVRVLIGSTFKLGIGANVQTKLKAIHHLDVPWRPADMIQREGRVLRRGNTNEEVFIFRYILEGSFDSYSWQILQTKQHFISQFLAGNNTVHSIEDFDNDELNYAQVKALALNEPLMKKYAEKENELRKARIILRQEIEQKEETYDKYTTLKSEIEELKDEISIRRENLKYIEDNLEAILLSVENQIAQITQKILSDKYDDKLIYLCEFKVSFVKSDLGNNSYIIMERLNQEYIVVMGKSLTGNKKRLNNYFKRFSNKLEIIENLLIRHEEKLHYYEAQLMVKSNTAKEIECLEDRLKSIFEEISKKL